MGAIAARGAELLNYGNCGFLPMQFGELDPAVRLKLFPWAYRFVEDGRGAASNSAEPGITWEPAQLAALDRRLKP